MAEQLKGKRVAFLFTEGVEQVELTEPLKAVREAGAEADLISLDRGEVQMFNHLDQGDKIEAGRAVSDADASEYDGLVVPGGVANPDALRTDDDAVRFVRDFFEQDKPVGIICHGPWRLVEADVASGRTVTSWPSLQTDLRNAGLIGSTGRSSSTTVSSRAASPTICRPSARRWWRRSPRDDTSSTSAPVLARPPRGRHSEPGPGGRWCGRAGALLSSIAPAPRAPRDH